MIVLRRDVVRAPRVHNQTELGPPSAANLRVQGGPRYFQNLGVRPGFGYHRRACCERAGDFWGPIGSLAILGAGSRLGPEWLTLVITMRLCSK